jgi:hypothetical protein
LSSVSPGNDATRTVRFLFYLHRNGGGQGFFETGYVHYDVATWRPLDCAISGCDSTKRDEINQHREARVLIRVGQPLQHPPVRIKVASFDKSTLQSRKLVPTFDRDPKINV